MMRFVVFLIAAGAVSIALFWAGELGIGPVVITREDQHKVITRFGEPVKILDRPGPSWKIPLLDSVIVLDRRLQHMDAQPVDVLIAGGEKLITDYYAVWRIVDPKAFIQSFPQAQSDPVFGMNKAAARIQEAVNALVGAKVAELELEQLLQRSEIVGRLAEETNRELAGTGVEVIDVRISRTELPREAEASTYAQMREQQRALAREYRARGQREARQLRAESRRRARTTLAEANAFAERMRGEGDAGAARIYAQAYGKAPAFYGFVRSLEAYRKTLGEGSTLILPPDEGFFRFLGSGPPATPGQGERRAAQGR